MNIDYRKKCINILRNVLENKVINLKLTPEIISSFSESKYKDDGDLIYKSTSCFDSISIHNTMVTVKYDVFSNNASRYSQTASSSVYTLNLIFSFSEIFYKPRANYYPNIAQKLKKLFDSCSLEMHIPLTLLDDMLYSFIETDGSTISSVTSRIISVKFEEGNIVIYHEIEESKITPPNSNSNKYLKKIRFSLDEIFNS